MAINCPGCSRVFDERFQMLQHASSETKKGCWDNCSLEDQEWWVANYGGGVGGGDDTRNIEVIMTVPVKAGDNIAQLKGVIRSMVQSNCTLKDKDNDMVPNHIALSDVPFGRSRKLWLESTTPSMTSSSSARSKPY